MATGLLHKGWISYQAIRDSKGKYPAKAWLDGLPARERGRARAGLANIDNSFHYNRPTGRISKIKGARYSLLELKLTKPGTPGPQLRLLGVRRGSTFYVAHAFSKTSAKISGGDIKRAEEMVAFLDQEGDLNEGKGSRIHRGS